MYIIFLLYRSHFNSFAWFPTDKIQEADIWPKMFTFFVSQVNKKVFSLMKLQQFCMLLCYAPTMSTRFSFCTKPIVFAFIWCLLDNEDALISRIFGWVE